jgi:CelD/BcsL family acetyltransferase involved in cellulose biosynthesis
MSEFMLKVSEFNTIAELAKLRTIWGTLLDATPNATWFQSLEWLETYWQFYGKGQRLRVLLVEAGGKPIGILPLVVVTETRRIGRVEVLTYPLHGWASFYGPIGPNPTETLQAGLRHIQNTAHDWDLIDFRWVAETEGGCAAESTALQLAGFDHSINLWHTSAQVDLHAGWQGYWNARKSVWRSNVRRCRRRLEEQFVVNHVRYRPLGAAHGQADPRWDLYEACEQIARRSWQGSSQSGTTLSHEVACDYFRASHAAAAKAGAVDLNLLLLDGQPAAFAYNYHFQGSVYGLRSGFDAAIAQDGAGTLLMAEMIEDSCRRGDTLIDLGPDYLDCKRYWQTQLKPALHFTHYRPSGIRAQALRCKHSIDRWLPGTKRATTKGKQGGKKSTPSSALRSR